MSTSSEGAWKEAKDAQGRTYYYHATTKQTAWVLPPGAVLVTKKRMSSASGSLSNAPTVAAAAQPVVAVQPVASTPTDSDDPWVECREVGSGRTLFYHSSSMQIVFDAKPGSAAAAAAVAAPTKHEIVKRSADQPAQDETPTSARAKLLNFNKLGWDFYNERCEYFRAQAARVPHSEYQPTPEAIVCPRYFSTAPVPPNPSNSFSVVVRLPASLLKNEAMSSTKLFLRNTDSAQEAVEKALKKCQDNLDSTQFVFKVTGRGEYIYGPEPVMDYEYVRYCQRHQQEINLTLVQMTLEERQTVKFPAEWLQPVDYESKYKDAKVYGASEFAQNSLKPGSARPQEPFAFSSFDHIPLSDLKCPYRIRVVEAINVRALPRWSANLESVIIKTELRIGTYPIKGSQLATRASPFTDAPMYHQWLTTQNNMLAFSSLPRETRLCMMVYGVTLERKELLLGYVNQQLFDARGFMLSGVNSLKMWALPEGKPSDTELSFLSQGTTWENMAAPVDKCCMLTFEIDSFEYPVVCPLHPPPLVINEMQVGAKVAANMIPKATMTHLESIVGSDPLREMNDEDKALLWVHRHHFVQRPTALAKFLQTVDWCDKQKQAEAHRLLQTWAPLNPYEAFELLDSRYPDTTVREYSVQCLSGISDSELAELLLQFVQVLKYEPYHDSALTRFLIQRCLKNPYQLGHYFFWHLKAEMHNHDFCERHGLIMEEYLMHAGHHAVELQVQNKIVNSMLEIADHIVHCRTVLKMEKPACMEELRTSMEALNQELPSQFQVSLNPRWVAKKLRPEKCRYMSSKKVPLWLVFENADPDGSDFVAMFKSGDDLRQDILTLQLMRMMDRVWLSEGLDLRLKPYSVIATGVNELNEGAGMLEMVLNSTTISDVQVTYGGGAMGALRNDPLDLYIHAKNPDPKQYEDAVDNFCRSCAGYCVATYVLGIGDRHNGNIMMTQSGHLFHIDFGHFLGNFKSKFGFKRERSPFVFTPEMAYVMGGDDYAKHKLYLSFVDMCCAANNVLRKNASLWIALFVLMQTAGMPELMSHEDVYYLRDMLTLGVSESEASAKFKTEIQNSVSDNYRRIDNAIHNAIHG